jgi:glycosyltransferase involved in cell wall biosynthesis
MRSISVVVPLFNESESLEELHRQLDEVSQGLEGTWEFIYVDDGSWDGSFELVRQQQAQDPRIRIVRFRRNFGKSAALSAGFRLATGQVIVTMDADLQDQPSEIVKLIEHLEQGNDLVSGWKRRRRDPWTKRWPSKLFNWTTAILTGVPLHDINCGLKAYRREVIEEIKVYGEMHRYIPVLASYKGFTVSEVSVVHQPRQFGKSKYGVSRFFGGFFDLLTVIMLNRYNSKPLHIFGILGGILFGLGFLIETYLTVGWFLGSYIEDRPLFLLGIMLLIVGIQLVFFGLLAEMIAYSSRREDDYSIREILIPEVNQSEVPARLPQ